MIPAGMSELRSAFHRHTAAVGRNDSTSHQLLWFYAIECGLKSVYLRRRALPTTAQMPQELLGNHDLGRLVHHGVSPSGVPRHRMCVVV